MMRAVRVSRQRKTWLWLEMAFVAGVLGVAGCGGGSASPRHDGAAGAGGHGAATGQTDGGSDAEPAQSLALVVTAVDPTFRTEDHFIAAVEMQLAGEPFAEAMGRDLGGYSRNYACSDPSCQASRYADPSLAADAGAQIDLPGYAAAIESYEYSKQPMNNVAFESGAGTSLLFGPVLNPNAATGADALALAQAWFQHMASGSNLGGAFFQPAGDGNPLGWRGLWPVLQPFSSWNPAIAPTSDVSLNCSLSSDDNPGQHGALLSNDYECDATTLNLPDRAHQVSMTIGPGPSGWSDWKEALWTINYLQILHATKEVPIDSVPEAQLAQVGQPGNLVPGWIIPGAYLGSSNIEGFQAGTFIQILDNQAAQWLSSLSTADGRALGGFASLADALAYGPQAPLRWFPASIAVTEAADASGFPAPSAYTIASPDSHLLDLAGLLGGYATSYALTDLGNAEVGGSQPVRAYFDGDPFPVQNQTADGQPTLHDRALAMMRVALVDLDRLHVDPASGLPVDDVTLAGGQIARGATLSADVAAYTLLALRTARRSLDAQLTLYANTTPDSAGIPTPLDGFPGLGPGAGVPFSTRLDQLIGVLAGAFLDKLTTTAGVAYGGFDVARGAPADDGGTLDAHAAAVRGLLVAYLATGATKYRDRAALVFSRLESTFYDPGARVYRARTGDRSATVTFTPRRLGLLQGALRDAYELIGALPGQGALAARIAERFGRLDKLVLNGWDDRDGDLQVQWPSECAGLGPGPGGALIGLGGLQMAERTLSGDTGSVEDDAGARVVTGDRERDCVPEISAARLPSALAASITFAVVPWSPANRGQVYRGGAWVSP